MDQRNRPNYEAKRRKEKKRKSERDHCTHSHTDSLTHTIVNTYTHSNKRNRNTLSKGNIGRQNIVGHQTNASAKCIALFAL